MYKVLKKARDRNGKYKVIFIAALLLSFHYYLITYINSTFLGNFVNTNTVGILYAIASTINIFLFLKTPYLINKYGNYKFIKIISIVEVVGILCMALSKSPYIVVLAFVVHYSINSVILSCLDMYLEDSSNGESMGKLRGTFLTIISIAAIASPLAIGSLIEDGHFTRIYLFSALFM